MPRSISALSVSPAVLEALKPNTTGEVHSVFERTFNILVDRKLVGISRSDIPRNPINMITDIPAGVTVQSLGVEKSMPVVIEENRLTVEDVLEISLGGASLWIPRTEVENPLAPDLVWRNFELAKRAAMKVQVGDGLAPLLRRVDDISNEEWPKIGGLNDVSKKVLPPLSSLIEGVKKGDMGKVKDAVGKLIGLGPGLTPCADDLLSGFSSSLWWVSHSFGKSIGYVESISGEIVAQSERTNMLSRQLLEHAAKGENDERAEKLLAALLGESSPEIELLVRRVMEIGETSGIDMMIGILLGTELGLEMVE
jgi:hypothetical protein